MFSQAITPEANLLLTALLVVWAALLFGGFIFGKLNVERTRRMPTWTRLSSSFVLVIAGIFWFVAATDPVLYMTSCYGCKLITFSDNGWKAEYYAALISLGMTLGFIGDIFMSRKNLIGGLSSFGLGHIAYIAAFIVFSDAMGLNNATIRLGAWIVWLVIGVIAWYITVYRAKPHTALHWAALAYCLLLSSTAGFATGLALQSALFIPLAIGAALFLFSDLLITVQLFMHKSFYLIDDVVWLTYGPAQALIVYSVNAALLVV
jgi:hypothetical protein